jgi:nicotinate-nucleotide adenylyltransferase
VYSRPAVELGDLATHPHVKTFQAPLLDISATYIRECIRTGKSVQYLVPEAVFEYLSGRAMYKK